MPDAVVIGAGLGGLAAALGLQRAGWEVSVFEKAPGLARQAGSISLWPNGMAALAALGVRPAKAEVVERMTLRDARGRVLADLDLAVMARRHAHPSVTVWRQNLLDELAGHVGGNIEFGRRCVGVQSRPRSAVASFADGTTAEADLVVGADGVGSAVRDSLWGGRARYAGTTCWEGRLRRSAGAVAPETILAVADGSTFGAGFGFSDGQAHWFADRPQHLGSESPTLEAIRAVCHDWPDPFGALVGATASEDLFETPIYVRPPPRRWSRGRTVLLGDSAHGMGPALGQGAAQAFTDAVVLATALASAASVERALATYQRRRMASVWNLWVSSYLVLRVRRSGLFASLIRAVPGRVANAAFATSARPARAIRRAVAISG